MSDVFHRYSVAYMTSETFLTYEEAKAFYDRLAASGAHFQLELYDAEDDVVIAECD